VLEKLGSLIDQSSTSAVLKVFRDYSVIFLTASQRVIQNARVVSIFPRRRKLSAIELFLDDGTSYLFDFESPDPSAFAKISKKSVFPNCSIFPRPDLLSSLKLDDQWVTGSLSNFEYIIWLNFLFGRSFRDPSEYPFFPSLMTDFDDSSSFTADFLSKPPAAISVDLSLKIRDAFRRDLVPADYFFDPDRFDSLPSWAPTAHHFIQVLRVFLESSAVTAKLHVWITSVFRPLLGENPHRPHIPPSPPKITSQRNFDLPGRSVLACAEVRNGAVLLVLSDGSSALLTYTYNPEFHPILVAISPAAPLHPDVVFSSGCGHVAAFSRALQSVTIFGEPNAMTTPLFTEIPLIVPLADGLLWCPDPCSIAAGDRRLARFNSRVCALAAKPKLKAAAVATADGYLNVVDLFSGEIDARIRLSGRPRLLAMTPQWGVIVAMIGRAEVTAVDTGGREVGKAQEDGCRGLWAVGSTGGADCIVGEGVGGTVWVADAQRWERRATLAEVKEKIAGVVLDRQAGVVLIIGTGVRISVAPLPEFLP
jgi:hypothetical protein